MVDVTPFLLVKTSSEPQKQPDPKVSLKAIICTCLNLFDPPFVLQVGQYLHERIIIDIDIVKDDRMVDLAKFLDELFNSDLFLLVFPVLHI